MNKSERIFRFHRLVKSGRRPSLKKIAYELECSESTVNRIKQTLIYYFSAPLKYDPSANGYYYDESVEKFDLPGFWLSPDEIYALFVCVQVIEKNQEVGISSIINPLSSKIEEIIKGLGHSPQDLKSLIKVMPLYSRVLRKKDFSKVCSSLVNREIIEVQYYKRTCGSKSLRKLHPQRILHYKDNWYLCAYCEKHKEFRVFSVENIKIINIEPGAKIFSKEKIDLFMEDGFGVFSGKAEHTAKLRFFEPNLNWVKDEIWHKNQNQYYDGKDLILEIPFSNPTELVMEVLRHGEGVVVESPKFLKDLVVEKLKKNLKKYLGSVSL
ncbi:MAG: WYL domain-containing protein [Desulforegulaceae bacterium]|nr:WYL domain-containing protein [Desulforegulaceae bacterium]